MTGCYRNNLLSKRVHIGYGKLANVIEYEVTFTVPKDERHTYAQFEAVTAYMPLEFNRFWAVEPESGKLQELDDGPGEQQFPIIFATERGTHALGVFSPDQPSLGYETAGYGRFRFNAEKVVKWNCVFRLRNATRGITAFGCSSLSGALDDARTSLGSLVQEFAGK